MYKDDTRKCPFNKFEECIKSDCMLYFEEGDNAPISLCSFAKIAIGLEELTNKVKH